MVDKDIVLRKVEHIQRCLKRIRDVTELRPERLDVLDAQDIFVLNLQRAVQAAMDLAAHVIASEGLGLPSSLKENFTLLQNAGILSEDLSERLQRMVSFRNIAVHAYESIDVDVLKSILKHNLVDLEGFYTAIVQRFSL